tara:strand:- start:1464 stop:1745 length:282 start_codon:yes stop_codon:yes gene_type:complete
MTVSELMLQRQASIEQTRAIEHKIRDALATLYGVTRGTHVQCYKRTLIVTKTATSFRESAPRFYVTGTDTLHPTSEHIYGWDPKHCRIIPKTP